MAKATARKKKQPWQAWVSVKWKAGTPDDAWKGWKKEKHIKAAWTTTGDWDFSTIAVENPSRMENRRIRTVVGLRYADAQKVAVILKDIETMLRSHPEIDTRKTLFVHLIEFGPSSLNFLIYTFTKTTDWVRFQAIQQDVFLKILEVIHGHGAKCAFPTTTVHIPEGIGT